MKKRIKCLVPGLKRSSDKPTMKIARVGDFTASVNDSSLEYVAPESREILVKN